MQLSKYFRIPVHLMSFIFFWLTLDAREGLFFLSSGITIYLKWRSDALLYILLFLIYFLYKVAILPMSSMPLLMRQNLLDYILKFYGLHIAALRLDFVCLFVCLPLLHQVGFRVVHNYVKQTKCIKLKQYKITKYRKANYSQLITVDITLRPRNKLN